MSKQSNKIEGSAGEVGQSEGEADRAPEQKDSPEVKKRDKQDWMFNKLEFDKINAEIGPFTLDAAADDYGQNAVVFFFNFCSKKNSFLDYKGTEKDRIWANFPFEQLEEFFDTLSGIKEEISWN